MLGYGHLIVKKKFGADSQLNNANLTDDQKKAIQFTVTGYRNTLINDDGTAQTGNEIIYGYLNFLCFEQSRGREVFQKKFEKVPAGSLLCKGDEQKVFQTLYHSCSISSQGSNVESKVVNEGQCLHKYLYP